MEAPGLALETVQLELAEVVGTEAMLTVRLSLPDHHAVVEAFLQSILSISEDLAEMEATGLALETVQLGMADLVGTEAMLTAQLS